MKWNEINNISIGIDIIEHSEIQKLSEKDIKRFLTKKELDDYFGKEETYKIQFLAGRWAAKEAIYKAINSFIKINLISIEIVNNKFGEPTCNNIKNIKLSISHSKNYTIASAIYIKND